VFLGGLVVPRNPAKFAPSCSSEGVRGIVYHPDRSEGKKSRSSRLKSNARFLGRCGATATMPKQGARKPQESEEGLGGMGVPS